MQDHNYWRAAAQERSKVGATRDGLPWTQDEDTLLRGLESHALDVVEGTSETLRRTVYSVEQRLRQLGLTDAAVRNSSPAFDPGTVEVCPDCHIALPRTGICNNC